MVAKDKENENAVFKSEHKFDSIDEFEQFLNENNLNCECEGEIKEISISEKRKVAPNLFKLEAYKRLLTKMGIYIR